MNYFNPFKNSLFAIICTAIIAIGCSTNSSDSGTATINGSYSGESSEQQKVAMNSVEGVVVTAARVTSSGNLETIDGTETETNASGNFTLEVDTDVAEHIVIVAENEGKQWKGYLSGKVENGSSYTLKPIDSESNAETEVYTRLVAAGDAALAHKSDVETVVTSTIAAEIESNATTATQIAQGLSNAAEARAEYYGEIADNESEAALEATYEALAEAQFRLESELAASASIEAREEAYEVFAEGVVNAYTNAGLNASEAATSIEMWSRVMVNSISSVSSDARNEVRKHVSVMAATAIDLAVRAEAEANGMSESSQDAIIQAGVELRSAVKASAGVADQVKAAFEEYHEEVRTTMESDTSFEASVVVEVDSEINAVGGAKSTFSSAIAGSVSSTVVNEIYMTFTNSIYGNAETIMEGSNEAQVEAIARMLLLINLAS